jgi:hypothetical protein
MKAQQTLIELDDPKQAPAWKAYLEYLLEYRPEQAWELFQSKKLESLLDERATQIVNSEENMIKLGRSRDEARETAYEEFMPSNTDLPDQEQLAPVWEDQQRQILAWAEDLRSQTKTETT